MVKFLVGFRESLSLNESLIEMPQPKVEWDTIPPIIMSFLTPFFLHY